MIVENNKKLLYTGSKAQTDEAFDAVVTGGYQQLWALQVSGSKFKSF